MHAHGCAQSTCKPASYHGVRDGGSRAAKKPAHPPVQRREGSPRFILASAFPASVFFPALRSHTVPAAGTLCKRRLMLPPPLPPSWVSHASTRSCGSKPGPVPASERLAPANRTSAPARGISPCSGAGGAGGGGGAAPGPRAAIPTARRSQDYRGGWARPPHRAAERRACPQPRSLAPHQDGGRCSRQPPLLPARLPSKRDAAAGPLPQPCLQQGMTDPCRRTLPTRDALAACGGLGMAEGSLHPGRAPFHSYKVFSPQTHWGGGGQRQAGSLDAGLGMPGAEPRGRREKK